MALPSEEDIIKGARKPGNSAEDTGDEEALDGAGVDEAGGVEVVIEDDTPEQDRGRKPLGEDPEPSDDEVEEYSEKVKSRINKMRHGLHDERRAKEAALRERDEAVALAQRIVAEKKALEDRNTLGESAYVAQAKQRVDLAIQNAKRAYQEAYEEGDGAKLADAQEQLSALVVEKQQVEAWARKQAEGKKDAETSLQTDEPVVKKQQPSSQPVVTRDEDAEKWVEKNPWFNKDKVMTAVAYAIHDELVETGVDPRTEADEYYGTLNKRLRERFPEHNWGDTPKKQKTHTPVASVGRTTSSSKRVVLTQTQVSLARRLGLTPEQYASELAKLERK